MNDKLIETPGNNGNGNCAYGNDIGEAQKLFVEDLTPLCKSFLISSAFRKVEVQRDQPHGNKRLPSSNWRSSFHSTDSFICANIYNSAHPYIFLNCIHIPTKNIVKTALKCISMI
ncbi:MAG TPA: hypothetical protein DEH25_12405 [Chloroflexi bacterium]|nr:hypothetical protein [Chloroflexota bacterium]